MDWHYAENGQQLGPVSEEQLLQLAHSGVVKGDTLVWHTGMTDWKPFQAASPGAPQPVPGSAPNDASKRFCTSCGGQFAASDLAMFGESAICAECKPAWIQRLRQGMASTAAANFQYAGFWIRFGAVCIDGLILGVVQGAIFFGLYGGALFDIFRQAARGADPANTAALMAPVMSSIAVFQLLSFAISIAYHVFFWAKYGATPGKMAVGIKVVTPDGGPIGTGRAIGRYFGFILSGLILYIGCMMAGWDSEKRALHDRLAGTRVIRVR